MQIFLVYESLAAIRAETIDSGITTASIINPNTNSFHVTPRFETVKLPIKVCITSAGMNSQFSNLASIPAEPCGTTLNFARKYPIRIKAKRNTIWLSVGKNKSMTFYEDPFLVKLLSELRNLSKQKCEDVGKCARNHKKCEYPTEYSGKKLSFVH